MGLVNAASKHLASLWTGSPQRQPPTMEEIQRSTAESHLAHEAKIQSLMDLVQVDDFEQLAFDDREKVRQYEAATVKGRRPTEEQGIVRRDGKKKGGIVPGLDDMGHILGDVTIEQAGNKNPIANLVVPIGTLALVGLIAWKALGVPASGSVPGRPPGDKITNVAPSFGTPQFKNANP